MKVLLVFPWNSNDKSYRGRFSTLLTYYPITLGTLAAIIENVRPDWEIDAVDEIARKVDYSGDYDLVMITTTTPAFKHGCEIAKIFRDRGIYVCIGGYHATYNPAEAMKHADTVFTGPGEYTIPMFIEDFECGKARDRYDGGCIAGKDLLSPDRSKISKKKYLKYPPVIANPGCIHRCNYCVISEMWNGTTERPVEDVIREIKELKSRIIVFFDPNFFGNRDYSIKLMKELEKLGKRWVGSATVDVGYDEELLVLAEKSGCNGLLFGLESLNQSSLNNAGKGFNKAEKYREAISNIKKHGIMANGCFVLGMDSDTEEELMDLPRQIDYLGLNLARFSILTPIPGTPLFKKMDEEGRIISKNWDDYTQHQAVIKPNHMSPERLEEIYRYVWKETYSYRNIFRRVRNITSKGIVPRLVGFGANIGFKYLGIDQ